MGWFKRKQPELSRLTHLSWVIPNQLALGGKPEPSDVIPLQQNRVQAILTLCPPKECNLSPEIKKNFAWLSIPLPDSHYKEPLTIEMLHPAVVAIHHAIRRKLTLYVHCREGIERSPTVCIAYLCCHQNMELWQALAHLKRIRPQSCPSPQQVQVIRQYIAASQGECDA
jgi:atypical dual specificity phosphatase